MAREPRGLGRRGLHPIRREQTELRTFALTGYLEGWAEYAAGRCDEIGMYTDPRARYGRITSERFFAPRMVVDTGLNALGWPLDRAAACLRESGVSGVDSSWHMSASNCRRA